MRRIHCVITHLRPARRNININTHCQYHPGRTSIWLFRTHPTPISAAIKRQPPPQQRMSSDDAYTSFLEKANADLQAGRQQEQQATMGIRTETVDVDEHIPAPLDRVGETFYVSDTDEPFEAVVLRWEGARKGVWPDYCIFFPFSFPFILLSYHCLASVHFLWRYSTILMLMDDKSTILLPRFHISPRKPVCDDDILPIL